VSGDDHHRISPAASVSGRCSPVVGGLELVTDSGDKVAVQKTLTISRATICPCFCPRRSPSSLLGRPTGLRTLGLSSWTGSPWNARQLASSHVRAMLTAAGVDQVCDEA